MELLLGVKSDPIEYRYSHEWLFDLLAREGVENVQIGSFFEIPLLDKRYFLDLRESAEKRGIRVRSLFTAHREVHGWFSGNPYLERAARKIYESLIMAGSLLGADYVGASAGSVLRDKIDRKETVEIGYFSHMKELMRMAADYGLKGLSIEVMSCAAEPPASPREIRRFMNELQGHHAENPSTTAQVYLCGDISHGYADSNGKVVYSNEALFIETLPYMCEFHFKNTDPLFDSTFGFSEKERAKGIVDLKALSRLIESRAGIIPVPELTGYLEHPGPKLGRDYSDYQLERMFVESIQAIQKEFNFSASYAKQT